MGRIVIVLRNAGTNQLEAQKCAAKLKKSLRNRKPFFITSTCDDVNETRLAIQEVFGLEQIAKDPCLNGYPVQKADIEGALNLLAKQTEPLIVFVTHDEHAERLPQAIAQRFGADEIPEVSHCQRGEWVSIAIPTEVLASA